MKVIEAQKFSKTPGGRFRSLGPASGEAFRELIVKALKGTPPEDVIVYLDGVEGYGSSFLEEAFGGVIRLQLVDPKQALERLHPRAKGREFETYAKEARYYMEDAYAHLGEKT